MSPLLARNPTANEVRQSFRDAAHVSVIAIRQKRGQVLNPGDFVIFETYDTVSVTTDIDEAHGIINPFYYNQHSRTRWVLVNHRYANNVRHDFDLRLPDIEPPSPETEIRRLNDQISELEYQLSNDGNWDDGCRGC